MTRPDHTIPWDRVPEGLADDLDRPPVPAVPRPAATIVLLRPGPEGGSEVLLLKRVRSAGFVPGAWVFPGGRVDRDDVRALPWLDGRDAAAAAARLRLPPDADPPAAAYYVAAVREAFEETGVLVASERAPGRSDTVRLLAARRALLDGEDLGSVLDDLDARMGGGRLAYVAHWITPEPEPRRYDTRFFAAAVGRHERVFPNDAELSEAVWLAPDEALARNRKGDLPMVFPTIKTLESLRGSEPPGELLARLEGQPVPERLPRFVRTPTGLGIELEDEPPG